MSTGTFFDESRQQSIIKAEIVAKYFWSWAKIIGKYSDAFAYIDLFAGPGRYVDGSASTPLRILETAIRDEEMRSKLVTIFNDLDSNHSRTLSTTVTLN